MAPNKLIAKMASEFNKPNGISVLYEEDVQAKIWPLPVRKINGIGPKAEIKLAKLHLHTIGDIAAQEREWLIDNFGKSYGAWMHDAAWGRDDRPVVTESEPVSMSRETTFDRDLHAVRDRAELGAIFTDLCVQVAGDLQRKGYVGKTIGIKLRYDDFRIATRDQTIDQLHGGREDHPPGRGTMPQARRPGAAAAPAGGAGGQAGQGRLTRGAGRACHRRIALLRSPGCGTLTARGHARPLLVPGPAGLDPAVKPPRHCRTISSWWLAMCRLWASAKSGLFRAP